MKITIGNSVFEATLYHNPTTDAWKALLPLTIQMTALNGNEKYYYLKQPLPSKAAHIGTIQAGDLMLYGNNCLVLFYKTFHTSYTYTPIGRITDISGLAVAVGNDKGSITFELQ